MLTHLSLRLRIFLFFALLALGGAALVVGGMVLGYMRLGDPDALPAFIVAGLVASLAIIGLTTWVWVKFDEHVARPVEQLAAEMRARAHADVETGIDHAPARYLGDLAPAAAAVADHLTETRNAMAMEVGRETAKLSREKARLEALLAGSPDGVLFCTPEHNIALYNAQAGRVLGDTEALSLNRPLSDLLLPGPILQAYDRLRDPATAEDRADILCATVEGTRLLEARLHLMHLVGQETEAPGYVLRLRDQGRGLLVQAQRAHLLNDLLEGVTEALPTLPDPARADLTALTARIRREKSETDAKWWPLEALPAQTLATGLRARLARKDIPLTDDIADLRMRFDGFAAVRLLEKLALSWAGAGATGFHLSISIADSMTAMVTLSATGPTPTPDKIAQWLAAPLTPGFTRFSGRDVVLFHGTRVTVEPASDGRASLRFPLRLSLSGSRTGPAAMRYDFDLLHARLPDQLSEARLRQLDFVIFDTETTGLNPQVDEICQIAAVRVVNGKLQPGERFDMLVNPGRKIPPASTAVHHVTNEMVADAPEVAQALTRFHRFAGGCPLVAHNAPFDMAFLQRRESEIGLRFDQPILDTVLLSAILFGGSAEHTLDALCDRLAIGIPEQDRHTAIGDAIATATAFAKMIPMMEAASLPTLGQAIAAFDRHARLIRHLN